METITERKIDDYSLIDHGLDSSQHFNGCGTTYTQFEFVQTGAGDSFNDALEDCLEQIAMSDDIESSYLTYIENIEKMPDDVNERNRAYKHDVEFAANEYGLENEEYFEHLESSETHYYVSIRYNLTGE